MNETTNSYKLHRTAKIIYILMFLFLLLSCLIYLYNILAPLFYGIEWYLEENQAQATSDLVDLVSLLIFFVSIIWATITSIGAGDSHYRSHFVWQISTYIYSMFLISLLGIIFMNFIKVYVYFIKMYIEYFADNTTKLSNSENFVENHPTIFIVMFFIEVCWVLYFLMRLKRGYDFLKSGKAVPRYKMPW